MLPYDPTQTTPPPADRYAMVEDGPRPHALERIADALEAILAHLTAPPAETAPAPRPLAVGDRVEDISGGIGGSPVTGIVRAVQAATDGHGRRVKIEWVGRPSLPYSEATAYWWPASDFRRIDE